MCQFCELARERSKKTNHSYYSRWIRAESVLSWGGGRGKESWKTDMGQMFGKETCLIRRASSLSQDTPAHFSLYHFAYSLLVLFHYQSPVSSLFSFIQYFLEYSTCFLLWISKVNIHSPMSSLLSVFLLILCCQALW